jgi:hypothetical protein
MAILTDFMERKLLNHMFGAGSFTRLQSLYLGISTTAFSESDTASQALAKEPGSSGTTYNGNGYQRVSVYQVSGSSGLTVSTNSSNNFVDNRDQINFPQATTSNWGDIGYWALYEDQVPANGTSSSTIDADDGQKPLMIGSFSAAVTTNVGDQFRIATGDFDIFFPNAIHNTGTGGTSWNSEPYHSKVGLANLLGFVEYNLDLSWDYMAGNTQLNKLWMGVSTSAFGAGGSNTETFAGIQEPGYDISSYLTSQRSAYTNNGYTHRPEITFNQATTSNGVTTITNSNAVEFPECATNNWGDITHFAIFAGGDTDSNAEAHQRYAKYPASQNVTTGTSSSNAAPEQGRPFFIGALDATKTINVGDTLRFPAGSISIALD